jgi:hypothetical protein
MTEEYSFGYDEGYQAGWNAAMDSIPAAPAPEVRKPALKPLTDEQRLDVINKTWNKYLQGEGHDSFGWCLTEAIEAAHGITVEQK